MPELDPLGATVPVAATDPADLPRWIRTLNLTAPPVVEVTSTTQANTIRDAYRSACTAAWVTPKRLMVWNTQSENLERETTAGGWEYVAGRQHGATVIMQTTVLRAARDDVLFATEFRRASAGWTLASDGYNVIVPATGMYLFDLHGVISGTANDLGRVYVQFIVNDGGTPVRQGAVAEDGLHVTMVRPLTKGDRVKVEIYHAAGGQRAFTGEMQAVQLNSPNYV